jgi:23S rRNA (guanosine2251-2'-O)-methyltransferase
MNVYGINPVLAALEAGRVSRVCVGPKGVPPLQAASRGRIEHILPALNPRLAQVVRAAVRRGVPVDVVDPAEIEQMARGGLHQGVAAELRREDERWTPATIVAHAHQAPLIVVLDGVEDPQNVGAILRTADAAGVDGVIRQSRRAARLDGAAARASAGALPHVRIATVVNLARAVEELKAAGVWTVGLAGDGSDEYDEVDLTLPTALVVGAEGTGLRRLVREHCDRVARIPIVGHVGSLNASVATAIVLFEARRQRRARARSGA